MNIITNCCLGAFVVRDIFHQPFMNPFVWSWMNTVDTVFLINNYQDINFHKFDIIPHNNLFKDGCCFDIIVDGKITIVFSHYQFNSLYDKLFIDNQRNIVISNAIWEYVVEKYCTRVRRMYAYQEPPIFLLCDNRNGCGIYTEEQINDIYSHQEYKIVFCSEYDYSKYSSESFLFIHKNGNELSNILSSYGTVIKSFIS